MSNARAVAKSPKGAPFDSPRRSSQQTLCTFAALYSPFCIFRRLFRQLHFVLHLNFLLRDGNNLCPTQFGYRQASDFKPEFSIVPSRLCGVEVNGSASLRPAGA